MNSQSITILRTGRLFAFEMAVELLNKHAIPNHTHQENFGGLTQALPVAPSSGPGVWFVIDVPAMHAEQAKEILSSLPFPVTTAPDIWDSSHGEQPVLKWLQVAMLLMILGSFATMARKAWVFTHPPTTPILPGQILPLK